MLCQTFMASLFKITYLLSLEATLFRQPLLQKKAKAAIQKFSKLGRFWVFGRIYLTKVLIKALL